MVAGVLITPHHAATHYNPVSRILALGGEQLAILRLHEPPGTSNDVIQSHKGAIVAVQYTPYFKYIVTACNNAVSVGQFSLVHAFNTSLRINTCALQVIKVWDLMTGTCIFEFSADFRRGGGITAIDIDDSGRRYGIKAPGGGGGVVHQGFWRVS